MRYLITLILLLGIHASAAPKSPSDVVQDGTREVLEALTDPARQGDEHKAERRKSVRHTVDVYFDWDEMAKRCLGRHWQLQTIEDQRTFVDLFGQLLEASYMDSLDGYNRDRTDVTIRMIGEKSRDDKALVTTLVDMVERDTQKKTTISIDYSLHLKGGNWQVYDIKVEGVRLVSNYRDQFSSILERRSFQELLENIEKRVHGLDPND